jgi:GTPase
MKNQEVRILGGKQAHAPYPLFHFFASNAGLVSTSYTRYLANQIHETWGFSGCPITLFFKSPGRPGKKRNARVADMKGSSHP